jgi:LmbE family N-acetylglucosaminyl deacetylase
MDLAASKPRKLLCVVAHPDDECFAFGGALALAAAEGIESSVICFTDGQAATHRGDAASNEDLGQTRRAEFAASCRVLGVTHHELLDYQDGRLEFVDFTPTACLLVERIRSLQPDVVLTFGPDGGPNTHPDHTMVSCLTTAAFHWAASPKRFLNSGSVFTPARLFHVVTGFFIPGRPDPLPSPWTVNLDIRSVFDRKREAFRQHASQAPLMRTTEALFDQYGATEYYNLVACTSIRAAEIGTSLFSGLE